MKRILVTGATGHVGKAIINNIDYSDDLEIFAGVRVPENNFTDKPVKKIRFNFDDVDGCIDALEDLDYLFLLRPPHMLNIRKYFKPLINACIVKKVKHVIFLSVQGAEKSSLIPHNIIEKLLLKSGIPFTFLRAGYFMQNLNESLNHDIVENNRIYVPAGKTKFNWINADDIGIAASRILEAPESHANKIYTLTGTENFSFDQVAKIMSDVLETNIKYTSPNLLRYYFNKRSRGLKPAHVFMHTMQHYLLGFQEDPKITRDVEKLTGTAPEKLHHFIQVNKADWLKE